MSVAGQTYCHHIAVTASEIDHLGHVNNAVYLNWVQEAVVAHWERFAPSEALHDLFWIALTHEITYRRPAFLSDSIAAESVANRLVGARAFLTTVIRRGDELLAEVKSSWCCISSATQRPVRLPQAVASLFFPDTAA